MSSLRRHVIALLLWLIASFNIERLDLGSINTLDLEPVTYVVIAAVVFLPDRKSTRLNSSHCA